MADTADPFALAAAAADAFAAEVGVASHDVALVLGSGWGPAADRILFPDPPLLPGRGSPDMYNMAPPGSALES